MPQIPFILLMLIPMVVKSQTMMEVQLNPTLYSGAYHIRCNGGQDGEINTIVMGGEEPFSFLWSNGATTEDVDQLTAGTYTVTVTQNGGNTVSASVQLREPSLLDPSLYSPTYAGGTNISINGGQDGSIQLTGQGGTPPYEYLWSNSRQEQDLYDLMAGTYTVTVTDANACTQTRSITLTEPAVLTITSITSPAFNGYNIHCRDGNDGSINLTVTGGVAPYEFQWNNGSFDEDPTGLIAGEYAIRVIDQNGTQVESSITLTQPDALSLELSPFVYPNNYHISLFGGYDGSIVTTAGGGVTPYNFLWNDGNTLQNRTTLNHGNKSLTLTDANGCELNAELLLLEPASADWMMGGNENTDPATQFIGTKDSVDVVFRTNNQEHLRLDAAGNLKVKNLESTVAGLDLLFVDEQGIIKKKTAVCGSLKVEPWVIGGNTITTSPPLSGTAQRIGTCNDHHLVLTTNDQERMRVTLDGKVGIGTITPLNKMDVAGAVAIGSGFAGINTAPGNSLIVEGLVGIGQSNPIHEIDILSTNAYPMINLIQSGSTSCALNLGNNNGFWHISGPRSQDGANNPLGILWNDGSYHQLVTILDNGKVGIGTANPVLTFEVGHTSASGIAGGMNITNYSSTNNNSEIRFSNVSGPLWTIGTDVTHNGSENFFIYDVTANPPFGATRFIIDADGRVGIGVNPPSFWTTPVNYKLYVGDGIATRDVRVTNGPLPDYVFKETYPLKSISELEQFIRVNKHLPGLPSAAEVERNNGFELGDMMLKLLEKIEEQSLYIIDLQRQIDGIKNEINKTGK